VCCVVLRGAQHLAQLRVLQVPHGVVAAAAPAAAVAHGCGL
jgi:hypothetical protein